MDEDRLDRSNLSPEYRQFAGTAAVLAGIAGFAYAVSFVVLKDAGLSGLFLTVAPLFAMPALVAVYGFLRATDPAFALLGLALGLAGSIGASVHGATNLALVLHPPPPGPEVPNAIDPRGFLTFGLTGAALLILAWLARRSPELPTWVSPLGLLLGAVLVVTWLARLIILDATSPAVLGPALVAGVLSPVFYLGLGAWLLGWRPR
jgi:hypothetical protein